MRRKKGLRAQTAAIVEQTERMNMCFFCLARSWQKRVPRTTGRSCAERQRGIDPLDFRYLLGSIMLVDVLGDPLRFRVRVHGTDLVSRAGYDLTGKLLHDLPISDYQSYVIERREKLIETKETAVVRHDRVLDGKY